MLRIALLAILIGVASGPVGAQADPPGVDLTQLRGICDDVYQNFDAPRPYHYQYEQKIMAAAGLGPEDAPAVLRGRGDPNHPALERIRVMWRHAMAVNTRRMARGDRWGPLHCDKSNFDVQAGSILKYAVAMQNFRFLAIAVQVWRVDPNYVDPSDGRTVLDYVQAEIERTERGSASDLNQSLQTYYRILREAGALHRSELDR